jgi:transposase
MILRLIIHQKQLNAKDDYGDLNVRCLHTLNLWIIDGTFIKIYEYAMSCLELVEGHNPLADLYYRVSVLFSIINQDDVKKRNLKSNSTMSDPALKKIKNILKDWNSSGKRGRPGMPAHNFVAWLYSFIASGGNRKELFKNRISNTVYWNGLKKLLMSGQWDAIATVLYGELLDNLSKIADAPARLPYEAHAFCPPFTGMNDEDWVYISELLHQRVEFGRIWSALLRPKNLRASLNTILLAFVSGQNFASFTNKHANLIYVWGLLVYLAKTDALGDILDYLDRKYQMCRRRSDYLPWLKDKVVFSFLSQWREIDDRDYHRVSIYLPKQTSTRGRPPVGYRRVLDALFYALYNGVSLDNVPPKYRITPSVCIKNLVQLETSGAFYKIIETMNRHTEMDGHGNADACVSLQSAVQPDDLALDENALEQLFRTVIDKTPIKLKNAHNNNMLKNVVQWMLNMLDRSAVHPSYPLQTLTPATYWHYFNMWLLNGVYMDIHRFVFGAVHVDPNVDSPATLYYHLSSGLKQLLDVGAPAVSIQKLIFDENFSARIMTEHGDKISLPNAKFLNVLAYLILSGYNMKRILDEHRRCIAPVTYKLKYNKIIVSGIWKDIHISFYRNLMSVVDQLLSGRKTT